jgi:hypothetical protein
MADCGGKGKHMKANKITITEQKPGSFRVRVQRFGADMEGTRPTVQNALNTALATWNKIDNESPVVYVGGVPQERVWSEKAAEAMKAAQG